MADKKNREGYHDPTAYHAMTSVEKSEKQDTLRIIKEMVDHFDYVAMLNGFNIENRIIFKDRDGRLYK